VASLNIQQPQTDQLRVGQCPVCRSTIYADVVFNVRVFTSPNSNTAKIDATARAEFMSSTIEHTCKRDEDD
jgi:hypothetical protein